MPWSVSLARTARGAAAAAARDNVEGGAAAVVLAAAMEREEADADAAMDAVVAAAAAALEGCTAAPPGACGAQSFAPGHAVAAASSLAGAMVVLFEGEEGALRDPTRHAAAVHALVTKAVSRAAKALADAGTDEGATKAPLAVLRGAARLFLATPAHLFGRNDGDDSLTKALEAGIMTHAKATASCISIACHVSYHAVFDEALASYCVSNGAVDAACVASEWHSLDSAPAAFRTSVHRFTVHLLYHLIVNRQAKHARDLCARRMDAKAREPHIHTCFPFVQLAYDVLAVDKMVMRGTFEVAKVYVMNLATRRPPKGMQVHATAADAADILRAARGACGVETDATPPPLTAIAADAYVKLVGGAACRSLCRRGLADVALGFLVSDLELLPTEVDGVARTLVDLLPRPGTPVEADASSAADAEARAAVAAMRELTLSAKDSDATFEVDANLLHAIGRISELPAAPSLSGMDPDHPEALPAIARLRSVAAASAAARKTSYHQLALNVRVPERGNSPSGGAYVISTLADAVWALDHIIATAGREGGGVVGVDAEWRPETNWRAARGAEAADENVALPLGGSGVPPLVFPGGSHRVATLQLAVKDAAFVLDLPSLAAAYHADRAGSDATAFTSRLALVCLGNPCLIGHGIGEDLKRVRRGYGETFGGALQRFEA